jgi:hypothetical protein
MKKKTSTVYYEVYSMCILKNWWAVSVVGLWVDLSRSTHCFRVFKLFKLKYSFSNLDPCNAISWKQFVHFYFTTSVKAVRTMYTELVCTVGLLLDFMKSISPWQKQCCQIAAIIKQLCLCVISYYEEKRRKQRKRSGILKFF